MTTETSTTISRTVIDGTGPYNFSFRIFDDGELTVVVDTGDADAVPLTLDTHYTVAGVNDGEGGTVTLINGAETTYDGDTLDIRSNTLEYQPTSIRNQGRFLPEIHEDEFDRLSRQIQDLRRVVDSKFGYPDDTTLTGTMANRLSWLDRFLYVSSSGEIEPAAAINPQALSQSIIGSLIYPQSGAESGAGVAPDDTRYSYGVFVRYDPGISYANLRASAYVDGVINMGRDSVFNGVNVGKGRNTGNSRGTSIGVDALQSTGAGEDNTAVGYQAMTVCSGLRNTALGSRSMVAATSAYQNTAVGNESMRSITDGSRNVAVGESALYSIVNFAECTAVGAAALYSCNSHKNTAVGREAGYYITSGEHNVCIGYDSGFNQTTGDNNTFVGTYAGQGQQSLGVGISTTENCVAVGHSAMAQSTTSINCVAVGYNALTAVTTGSSCVAIGRDALLSMTTGQTNVAVGRISLDACTSGEENTAIGDNSLPSLTTGTGNTACGKNANGTTTGTNNTALGKDSLTAVSTETNCTGIGYQAAVTGSNQVQLGNSSSTVYAYGAVQDRSDARDKADIRDTALGLEFICRLRPVDFRWDYREDYNWGNKNGSKKRQRFHHGLIAQEVGAVCAALGIDFGGLQDHSRAGGADVQSIGYSELIGPLIKAVQQLSARVKELESRG